MSISVKWRSACVTFQQEMLHHYPQAATESKLEGVRFLANTHRHILHFKVSIQQFHDDRDIEFIQFKRWLQSLYTSGVLEANYQSCEMISDQLANAIHDRYPGRELKIEVFEDGENGSVTHYTPDYL
jgi:hypothetical protein